MDLMTGLPLVWAQAQPAPTNPSAISLIALRRWCGSLTLSSPRSAPDPHGLWALLAGLVVLFALVLVVQGPSRAFRQLFDVPGHVRLVRAGALRVRRASRMMATLIGFMVLSWTGAQSLVYSRESGRADLIQLLRSRARSELAVEQGTLAALTPFRDLAGLADNLPLLVAAAVLLFRASIEPHRAGEDGTSTAGPDRGRGSPGWTTTCWGIGAIYVLYRLVARAAGSPELPYGSCLMIETVLIPVAMAIVDGFLLAWILVELRNAGLDAAGEGRLDPLQPIALMPAAILAAVVALPSRYIATLVILANDRLPTSVQTTSLGTYIRWQLGGWGLADIQAAGMLAVGLVGAAAWTRGRVSDALTGYFRMLAAEGGHLVAALAVAGVATGVLSAAAYAVVLLLPPQSWVLAAADSYAHFLALPAGLWTASAFVELAQRSLPTANEARSAIPPAEAHASQPSTVHDSQSPIAAPAS